jgi:hypothetical protein
MCQADNGGSRIPLSLSAFSRMWLFPGDTWIIVVLISAWPMAFMMAKGSAPAKAIREPKVWRRPWTGT